MSNEKAHRSRVIAVSSDCPIRVSIFMMTESPRAPIGFQVVSRKGTPRL